MGGGRHVDARLRAVHLGLLRLRLRLRLRLLLLPLLRALPMVLQPLPLHSLGRVHIEPGRVLDQGSAFARAVSAEGPPVEVAPEEVLRAMRLVHDRDGRAVPAEAEQRHALLLEAIRAQQREVQLRSLHLLRLLGVRIVEDASNGGRQMGRIMPRVDQHLAVRCWSPGHGALERVGRLDARARITAGTQGRHVCREDARYPGVRWRQQNAAGACSTGALRRDDRRGPPLARVLAPLVPCTGLPLRGRLFGAVEAVNRQPHPRHVVGRLSTLEELAYQLERPTRNPATS